MGPKYVLQLLLMKKYKIAKYSTTAKAREKNKESFGILRILYKIFCRFDEI